MIILRKQERNDGLKGKIVFVSSSILDVDFFESSTVEILANLSKRGYSTYFVATRSKNVGQIKSSHVHVTQVPLRYVPVVSNVMYALVLVFLFPLYIVFYKSDFVVTHPDVSTISSMPWLFLRKFFRARFILDIRSTPVETRGLQGFLQESLFATSIIIAKKFFNGMTTITDLMKEEVCGDFSIPPNNVGVWTSGVSTTLFRPEGYLAESVDLKKRLGLSRKFVVFYHGGLRRTGGLIEVVESMKMIKKTGLSIVLFLLGAGQIAEVLENLVQSEALEDLVTIHEPVDYLEVPKYIGMSDVCIIPLPYNPYWRFQSPLKLLEYMAMEKVVIATDIPAHRLIMGEANCGVYISSATPSEIEKSIVFAYHNRDKLQDWGKVGRKIIEEKYTWEKVADELEDYLLSINRSQNRC
jgi:glycosyltransferase involved in cell wall biosynthesis